MRGYEYQGGVGDVGRYDGATATRLARRAVEAAAPHELPQFPMTAEAFHRSSAKYRLWPVHRDEPLGIGLDVVAAVISTAALSAAAQVLDQLAQQSTEQAVDTTRNRLLPRLLRRRTRRVLEPAAEPVSRPAEAERLTAEQLTRLREVARRAALQWRVPEPQAQAIADGIVAELATLPGERPTADGQPGEDGTAADQPGEDGPAADGQPGGDRPTADQPGGDEPGGDGQPGEEGPAEAAR